MSLTLSHYSQPLARVEQAPQRGVFPTKAIRLHEDQTALKFLELSEIFVPWIVRYHFGPSFNGNGL